jgi:hypothetical protein
VSTPFEKVALFHDLPVVDQEWLAEEFFTKRPNEEALRYLASHFEDLAATNSVDRAEWSRRAELLRRLADGLNS